VVFTHTAAFTTWWYSLTQLHLPPGGIHPHSCIYHLVVFTHIAAFTTWWYSPNIGGRETDIPNMQKKAKAKVLYSYLQALSAKG